MGRRWQVPPLGGIVEILLLEEVLGRHSGEEGGSGRRGQLGDSGADGGYSWPLMKGKET